MDSVAGELVQSQKRGLAHDPGSAAALAERSVDRAHRPVAVVVLDALAMLGFAVAVVWIALRLLAAPHGPADLALLPLEIAAGFLLADLASGLVHWFCDTFFAEHTPLVGPVFIRPFREHHRDPLAMTRHGFLETNGNNCLVLLILLIPTMSLGDPATPDTSAEWLPFRWIALSFSLATFLTNQLHKWAHLPAPRPAGVRLLQRTGLVLTPERHAVHHRAPHDRAFCVTVGWMNPLVDRGASGVRRLARAQKIRLERRRPGA